MNANSSPTPGRSQVTAVNQLATPLAKYRHTNSALLTFNQHLYTMDGPLVLQRRCDSFCNFQGVSKQIFTNTFITSNK